MSRLTLAWKPGLTALLVGDRKHYFYLPDSLVPVDQIDSEPVDAFLRAHGDVEPALQLLGFLSPETVLALPGYVQVTTGNEKDPGGWQARVYLSGEGTVLHERPVEIRVAGR